MTDSLTGKRILLTGASRGVGLQVAHLLIKGGAHVLGVARDQERLLKVEKQLNEKGKEHFVSLCADLMQESAISAITNRVSDLWGALDIVIHNAGVMLHHEGGILAEPLGKLEDSLQVNLLTPFRLTRALLPLLIKGEQPRIINVSSGAGTFEGLREPGIASYRLSKWALNGLTLLQAEELRGKVCVSAFDPGWVRTDLGGPQAPGTAEEAAAGLLNTLQTPWAESGSLLKDGHEIPW